FDILYITAHDLYGKEIYTWSWPITLPKEMATRLVDKGTGPVNVRENDEQLTLIANGVEVSFDQKTGLLQGVRNQKTAISFTNGPVLINGEAVFKSLHHYDTLGM